MTQTLLNSELKTPKQQLRMKMQGLPVRSSLRAGIVLQIDVPGVTVTPVTAEPPTPAAAATTPTV